MPADVPSPLDLPRPRVLRALTHALRQPVCVLTAAVGYGKTRAARALWQGFAGPKAWVTAGEERPAAGPPAGGWPALEQAAARAWTGTGDDGSGWSGLLTVDLGECGREHPAWNAIRACAEGMPAGARLLLLGREAPPALLARWRGQGRLARLDHAALTLDAEEWLAAGFSDEGARRRLLGWWGAALAAGADGVGPDAAADWAREVWWPTLDAEAQDCVGELALLPEQTLEEFCARSGRDVTPTGERLRELAAAGALVRWDAAGAAVAPAFRAAVIRAWRETRPDHWAAATDRALERCLEDAPERAAALALAADRGAGRVLRAAGWALLYGDDPHRVGALLDRCAIGNDAGLTLLRLAWHVEVDKTPHRADARLRRLLPALHGEERAAALTLLACAALDFDDPVRAGDLAREGLAGFGDDRAPASIRARLALGCALNVCGRLDEAEAELRRAQACAGRDRLPRLRLEGLQRRAHLAVSRGRTADAADWLESAQSLARELGLELSPAADSCRRLLAWLRLEALHVDAAEALLDGPVVWEFPYAVLRAAAALARDDTDAARAALVGIARDRGTTFLPFKWRLEAAFVESWFAARRGDAPALAALERELSDERGDGVIAARLATLTAGIRLLLGRAADAADDAACRERLAELRRQGAHGLARPLALILAVRSGDAAALADSLREAAAAQTALDFLWLGPCCAGPLAAVLERPERSREPEVFDFGRGILQRLLAPPPGLAAGPIPPEPRPQAPGLAPAPLPGLTARETQILRLIGQHYSNEQIAAGLFVSLATVKTHINHLYGKLGVTNRIDAIQRARQLFG